jgi:pyruvate/2-oxoglutarate dehydrogenase complex dihydrolipoamide dehydrogenase (E3) component
MRQFVVDGIDVRLSMTVTHVERRYDGSKVVYYHKQADDTETGEIECDEILVATGRLPNIEGLNLEAADVKADHRSGIQVNEYLQSTNSNIYAAGDCCTGLKQLFTHAADLQGRMVYSNAMSGNKQSISRVLLPWVTNTHPEVGHVGQSTESEPSENEVYMVKLWEVDRAVLDRTEGGFVRIAVKKGTDRILGATVVCDRAGELLAQLSMAIECGIGLRKLASLTHAYPSLSEAIRMCAEMCVQRSAHRKSRSFEIGDAHVSFG